MKRLIASFSLLCLSCWGQFCPKLVSNLGDPVVEYAAPTPAFTDTIEDLEIPYMRAAIGLALGKQAYRLGIDLASNRPLIAFLQKVLDDGLRQAARANRLNPHTQILIRIYLESDSVQVTFEDQAGLRINPWDCAQRRSVTGQGMPATEIWRTLIDLDLPYHFAFRNGGNIFTIAIPYDLAL